MDNFDLRKFLAEGKLFEEAAGYTYASCDGDSIELWDEGSLNDYVSDIAEDDYSGNKEAAMEYMEEEKMLTKLPNSPYLFIYANDERLDYISEDSKEEFVNEVDEAYHGTLEGLDVDEAFAKILDYADDSYIEGDSSDQQVVIENGKVVGGRA